MNKTRNLKAKHKTAPSPINICFQLTEYTVNKRLGGARLIGAGRVVTTGPNTFAQMKR